MRDASRSETMRRLMVYLSGVAIGLMLLGIFNARRTRELQTRQAEQAQRAAEQAAEVPASGLTEQPAANP